MKNMHKTTHDSHLTGVHWPIHRHRHRVGTKGDLDTGAGGTHRGARWRTEEVVYVTARSLDGVVYSPVCPSPKMRPHVIEHLSATLSTPQADRELKID